MGKKPKAKPADSAGDGGGDTKSGKQVYIRHKEYEWVPATLISQNDKEAVVNVPQYKDEFVIVSDGGKTAIGWQEQTVKLSQYAEFGNELPSQNVDPDTHELIKEEDMVNLKYLHEAGLMFNVKWRNNHELPYTRTGDILIAVNPYKYYERLTNEACKQNYANKLVWETHDKDPRTLVEPHIYEISSLCYRGLAADGQDQSILVSGESGAGKTESVKICMNHIANCQDGPSTGKPSEESVVIKRILESNPLLEAFGNAKTSRNDNSSRFGKYINLQFSKKDRMPGMNFERWELAGSKCEVYLLEKSRVTQHEMSEGTYHIFYYLLGATDKLKCEIWPGLKGTNYDSYKAVMTPPYIRKIEGNTDGENYELTLKTLDFIHVGNEALVTLMRAVAVSLTLGNITFTGDETASIGTKKDFDAAVELLGVDSEQFRLALIEKTMKTRNESMKVPLKPKAAYEACQAFAKEIYARLFLWLVREINSATCAEENYEPLGQTDFGIIGLLDIFGFESFKVNGFEQLSINYANEKLQQKFTKDIFQAVQLEYEAEGIDLDQITYDDNSDILDLIEGKNGLIKTLNECIKNPSGSDKLFVTNVMNKNKKYKWDKKNNPTGCVMPDMKAGPLGFIIHHYAGKVNYTADGFMERNVDKLPEDIQICAKTSVNEIVGKHLNNDAMSKSEVPVEKKGKGGDATIWTKFKGMLDSLMTNLSTTRSRYIRCIKPNTIKKPLLLQHKTTIEQLRCAGVVAAVSITRSAFPVSDTHEGAVRKFKIMRPMGTVVTGTDWTAQCVDLLDAVLKCKEKDGVKGYVMGKTKVYYRTGMTEFLEGTRSQHLTKWVIELQRFGRGYLLRKQLLTIRLMAKTPQAIQIQCWFRILRAKKELKKKIKWKKNEAKRRKKRKKACIKIQSIARMVIEKRKYVALLRKENEKKELKENIRKMEEEQAAKEKERQQELADAKEVAEKEIAEHKAKAEEELKNTKEELKKAARNQTIIEESSRIIDYLYKEHSKLDNHLDSARKENKSLKENNVRLTEANTSATESFKALHETTSKLNDKNAELIDTVSQYRHELTELKLDLKTRQQFYLAEAEIRLSFQKTMAQIVTTIQDRCRDPQLVEDTIIMALKCEGDAKASRAAMDEKKQNASSAAEVQKRASLRASLRASTRKQSAPVYDYGDDDSDDSDSS